MPQRCRALLQIGHMLLHSCASLKRPMQHFAKHFWGMLTIISKQMWLLRKSWSTLSTTLICRQMASFHWLQRSMQSLHCFGGSQIQWSIVYKYASEVLRRELRDRMQLVSKQVAMATAQKWMEICFKLWCGYWCPIMAALIAFYHLGLPRGVSAEATSQKPLLPTMEKPSDRTIVPTKKPVLILPVERLSQKWAIPDIL